MRWRRIADAAAAAAAYANSVSSRPDDLAALSESVDRLDLQFYVSTTSAFRNFSAASISLTAFRHATDSIFNEF